MKREPVLLMPLIDEQDFQDRVGLGQDKALGDFLRETPAIAVQPIDALLSRPLKDLRISSAGRGYSVPELRLSTSDGPPAAPAEGATAPAPAAAPAKKEIAGDTGKDATATLPEGHPESLTEAQAVQLAYGDEIERIASFLRAGLSVLVACDKLVVRHLWPLLARRAQKEALPLDVPAGDGGGLMPRSQRQQQLARLRDLLRGAHEGHVIVLPHLDLLGGGGDRNVSGEAREVTELLYEEPDRLLLAFIDRSLLLPEVLMARFAIRPELAGLPREVRLGPERTGPLGVCLVTRREAATFEGYKASELFKQVAGLNPVRLRHALAYAVETEASKGGSPESPAPVSRLFESIRAFKAQTSEQFVVPDVMWDDIGGYDDVKQIFHRALGLMSGAFHLPNESLRRELIPRGFLLYGPPGTGKTLFAKAIANQLHATIRVVSGPEVTDMYVGESERKLRAIFAEARRNAPSVIVFDEFDSIAASRSARDDGGSRAGNALVAQILTEMDGFRPDVPMLVIGTTNRLNLIDEALLRPSRFQPVPIALPDMLARRRIAEVHAAHFEVPVEPALLDLVADATHGFNGDQIRSIFRDARVGMSCEHPPMAPTPERLGYLVGRQRASADQQRLDSQGSRGAGAHPHSSGVAPDRRPRASSPMMPIANAPSAASRPGEGEGS